MAVSSWLFTRAYQKLTGIPLTGIRQELRKIIAIEPGRCCHLFFMLNDQRQHLVKHFEKIHKTRIDYILPFFDGRFLKTVLSSPVDPFIGHHLYNRLMDRLPSSLRLGQVPWQSYPGHEPCPISVNTNLRQQWGEGWFDKHAKIQQRKIEIMSIQKMLSSPNFPQHVLNRFTLHVAMALTRFGYYDCFWLLKSALAYCEAWRIECLSEKSTGHHS